MTDQEIIHEISHGNNSAFQELYDKYHSDFIRYIKAKYNGPSDDIIDLYQDSFIALYDNIICKKYVFKKDSTVKTYLFTIGSNKLIDLLRKQKSKCKFEDSEKATEEVYCMSDNNESNKFEIIRQAVNAMQEPCSTILSLFYWYDMSGKEIAEKQGYANADSVKTQKSKCMNKLKTYIINLYPRLETVIKSATRQ